MSTTRPNPIPSSALVSDRLNLVDRLAALLESSMRSRQALTQLAFALVYFAIGELSYRLSNLDTVISGSFYPHEGYALALGAAFGLRTLPSIFVGHIALVLFQGLPLQNALVSSLENIAVLSISCVFLKTFRFRSDLARPKDLLMLVAASLMAFQMLSRVAGLMLMGSGGLFALKLADLPEMLGNGLVDESIYQVLVATLLLTSLDELRRRRTMLYWISGFAATTCLSAVLAAVLWGAFGSLNPLHVFSIVYLVVMAITFAFGLHGASLANLSALMVIEWANSQHVGPFYHLLISQDQEGSVSTILLGVILSSSLVGALLREKEDKEKALLELATHDPLTGLFNRRYFFHAAGRELVRAQRHEVELLLLCLDLDHFKTINDTYGHAVGDTALVAMGDVLRSTLRRSDIAARVGGEEFVVLAYDARDPPMLGERLRAALRGHLAGHTDIIPFTVSIGVTRMRADDTDVANVLKRADDAMYEAKHQGRDRVVVRV